MACGVTAAPRGARVAIAVAFFVNGAAFANWVPRIPQVKGELGLSDGALGGALLGVGLGALAGSVLAGVLVSRYGSRRVTLAASAALCASIPLPALAPAWLALVAALVVVGLVDAVMDVAMNAHGVVVERGYGRSILNGFHAAWSLGAVTGALAGSVAAGAGIRPALHLAGSGLVLGTLALVAGRWLLPTVSDRDRREPGGRLAWPTRGVGLLGLLALCAALLESAPADWSAVYLAEDLGVSPGVAGAAYGAFSVTMLIGRLYGDAVVTRWGPVTTTRTGAALAGAGLACGLALGHPAAAVVGFALVGLGVCAVFPAAFGAAGHLPGLPSGAGIATVSLIARMGFLVGPPMIGAVSELTSLRLALLIPVLAAIAVGLLAPILARPGQPTTTPKSVPRR